MTPRVGSWRSYVIYFAQKGSFYLSSIISEGIRVHGTTSGRLLGSDTINNRHSQGILMIIFCALFFRDFSLPTHSATLWRKSNLANCSWQSWEIIPKREEFWLDGREGPPPSMLARTRSLSAAMFTVKFIFVTNSESHAVQYHNLIMGCHLTAQIHYFPQIYRHCCPYHSQHVMDGLYLNGFRCVIYTWQAPDSHGPQPVPEGLWRRFLLHGPLSTKPSGGKMLWQLM